MKSEQEIREEIAELKRLGMSVHKSERVDDSKGIAALKSRFLDCVSVEIDRLKWVLGE